MAKIINQKFQVGGDHYSKLKIQPWDVAECILTTDQFLGHLRMTAIKYLMRDKDNPIQDMEKAKHYIEKWLEVAKKEEEVDYDLIDDLLQDDEA